MSDVNEDHAATVEALIDALEGIGYDSVVVCADGSEPVATLDLGDNVILEVTARVRMVCDCCDLDGTHRHADCEHPCCPAYDVMDEIDPLGQG